MKSTSHWRKPRQDNAAALIIVLAFVVLLTGLAVAYLSRSTTDRQLSQSSFQDTSADALARSAFDIVIGDFRQEIVNGSSPTPSGNIPFYSPTPAANVVPQQSGTASDIPNLIRRSIYPDALNGNPGVGSRASAVNSTTDVSANGRWISLDRWNEHYLIPRQDAGAADNVTTPTSSFVAPDWVIVTRNGPVVFGSLSPIDPTLKDSTLTNTNYAVGRYAYAVYDEGGLLDINVAGYPTANSPLSVTDIGRKGVLAMADLTALPTTPGNFMSTTAINKFIGFRNYATTLQSGVTNMNFFFPDAVSFVNYYLGNPQIGTTRDFGTVNTTLYSGRTDQSFITRGELIKFRSTAAPTGIASANTLQYLGTFSREKNIPTWRAGGTTTANIEAALSQGRFYMGNLALVKPGATGVKQTIGLQWDQGQSQNAGYWAYHGPSNPAALDHIPALTGPSRHFAGLLNYALNRQGDDDYSNLGQTLALCAALIDQYDDATATDPSVPASPTTTTVISYNPAGVKTGEGKNYAYGIETFDSYRPPWAPIAPSGFVQLDRPFRNTGDLGYIFRQACIRSDNTLDLSSAVSKDSPVLDLFTYNQAPVRSGTINLNTRQPAALAAILTRALLSESPQTTLIAGDATNGAIAAANAIVNATATNPALSRADIVRLASQVTTPPFGSGVSDEIRETIPRALVECVQTRTWGLLIDLVAQTGHYPPNATSLSQFIVEGEKRYWLHVAIDRFDGTIVGQQLEEVTE